MESELYFVRLVLIGWVENVVKIAGKLVKVDVMCYRRLRYLQLVKVGELVVIQNMGVRVQNEKDTVVLQELK